MNPLKVKNIHDNASKHQVKDFLKKTPRANFPKNIKPMLATLRDEPFDEPGWLYEIKWDGYRALAYLNKGNVDLCSRNNKSFNEKFYSVYQALRRWKVNAVVDGEIIVESEKGISDFASLQTWRSEADGELVYLLFDILWLDGFDLTQLPLTERHEILKLITPSEGDIRLSENFETDGIAFFTAAEEMQLEGIIAKKEDSKYTPGIRSTEWLKIKTEKTQEAIIAGYTRNENTSKQFSALLMGVYENGELKFTGPVGTGFSNNVQTDILRKLKPLETSVCPFKEVPEYNKPSRFRPNPPKAEVKWVKPILVADISYRTLTNDGSFRHPSFKGLRHDKGPEIATVGKAKDTAVLINKKSLISKTDNKILKSPGNKVRKTLLNPNDETQVRSIGGHDLKFTNLSKIFWPKIDVTKRDMINYYYRIAPYMLPYMKDRPQTLNRHPNGINGESFYQKDITGKAPHWIKSFPYYSDSDEREKNFLVCNDEASLLYIASLGCIEMNPWSSRSQSPGNPDWCIIDLDPDKNTFQQVVIAAQVSKQVLDAVEAPCFCKTSGSTGLHIYIPMGAKYSYEQSKEFGRVIAKLVNLEIPAFTSIERLTSNRGGKMYIDFLQNRPQATLAAPYSLRPKPGAPVSTPLYWDEVKKGLKILDFTIFNVVNRVNEIGDIYKPVLGKGINLEKVLKKINSVFG